MVISQRSFLVMLFSQFSLYIFSLIRNIMIYFIYFWQTYETHRPHWKVRAKNIPEDITKKSKRQPARSEG
ncbi:hypothetical protein SETIT_5G348700v2 [Setaria italica]|uniref:Uncharacterized protein n=1 Tax=Setaria italica TaxID=4555 RepID=A0A368RC04_SETIT|nr:hypothetical protein SETIT_5G348700v2 [Setaria italica]